MSMLHAANKKGISILENVGEMGVPLPKILKDVLEKLNSGGSKAGDDKDDDKDDDGNDTNV